MRGTKFPAWDLLLTQEKCKDGEGDHVRGARTEIRRTISG
jgi:hypothetical protein